MSSRKLSLQIWRLQRLSSVQKALRPPEAGFAPRLQRPATCSVGRRHYGTKQNNDFEVREFIRKSPDSTETVEIEPDTDTKIEAEALRLEVDQLRQELEELREGPFGPNSEFMKALPEHLRERVLKALEERGHTGPIDLDLEEDISDDDFDKIVDEEDLDMDTTMKQQLEDGKKPPMVHLSLPTKSKIYVTHFNQALGRANNDPSDPDSRLALWKSYLRCRAHIPNFADMVSDEVLDIIWESQAQGDQRMKTIPMLAEDVLGINKLLTGFQWVEYLECLNTRGDPALALEKWENIRDALEEDADSRNDFMNLGIRLYASTDQPEKALQLTDARHDTRLSPRSLIPVIMAFARRKSSGSAEKSWALYLRLRSIAGREITMKDFEDISTNLLIADRPDLALAVFKDMLIYQQGSSTDSLELYKAAHNYISEIQSTNVSEEEVNRISLAALTILPRSFQNKFFYASWIKKLIGLGEIDAAATVVELMYARGVKPDAKHMNGIIGAWMRQCGEDPCKKAEAMAWAMIEQRVRHTKERASDSLARRKVESRQLAVQRPVPAATIETFSILLQHYLHQGLAEKASHLMDGLEVAEIKPDAFIMNQWLRAHLRKGHADMAWKAYNTYRAAGVKPDLETFACLFDCGKLQYDSHRGYDSPQFPRARTLYLEMSKWLEGLHENEWQETKDLFSRDLYDQIIRCFCLSHDLRGALCALHGLKDDAGLYPDANTARMILLAVSRHLGVMDADSGDLEPLQGRQVPGRHVRRRRAAKNPKASFAKVSTLLDSVASSKEIKVFDQGLDPAALDDQQKAEIQLEIMTEFIAIVLARNVPSTDAASPPALRERVDRAAESMGVRDVKIDWDAIVGKIAV